MVYWLYSVYYLIYWIVTYKIGLLFKKLQNLNYWFEWQTNKSDDEQSKYLSKGNLGAVWLPENKSMSYICQTNSWSDLNDLAGILFNFHLSASYAPIQESPIPNPNLNIVVEFFREL